MSKPKRAPFVVFFPSRISQAVRIALGLPPRQIIVKPNL